MPRTIISTELRVHIRELDQDRCAYCHAPVSLSVAVFEIDHIVPKSTGGETAVDNLCLACPPCNRHKGTKQQVFDPDAEQWVSLYHPRRQKWSAHFSWNGDGTVLLGLTPVGRVTIRALRINRPQMVRLRDIWKKSGLFLS